MTFITYDDLSSDRPQEFESSHDAGLSYNYMATQFNGTDESVNCGTTVGNFEYSDPFSIIAWLNTSISDAVIRPLISRVSSDRGWHFSLYSGEARLSLANTIGSLEASIEVDTGVAVGAWRQVIVTYDGTNLVSGMEGYVQGSLSAKTTLSDTLSTNTTVGSRNLLLGKVTISAADTFYSGLAGEIALLDVELDSDDVTEAYGPGRPTNLWDMSFAANIVGLWRMGDGASSTVIPSEASSAGDGTLSNMDETNYVDYT